MSKTTISRRQVLKGAGGFVLGLPLLPSLLSREALAADTPFKPRFVALATQHGGIWEQNMYPEFSTLTRKQMFGGHEARAGQLVRAVADGRARISHVLSADASKLTAALVAKMNVIRGVDIPFYIAHHTGGHLGNYARNDGNGGDGKVVQESPMPTIDQIMAWSDAFYPDLAGVRERSMVIGNGRMSYNYSNPGMKTGDIQDIAATTSSLQLFNRIFMPNEGPETMRTPIADRVLENYNRLRQSNKRLSAEDRRRLEEHVERIDELQRRLNTRVSCSDVQIPSKDSRTVRNQPDYRIKPESMSEFWQLHNDVIVTAFTCGTSRIATMNCGDTFSMYSGDWHQEIAHQANLADGNAQRTIADAHQRFFEQVYLDLISKLNAVEEAPGVTLLDNTLVKWTQESGIATHNSYSIPIITAGSACGKLQTGQYVDYRNLGKQKTYGENPNMKDHPGLIYNQWLGNVLDVMGVPKAEYERGGRGGYGVFYIGTHGWYQQPDFYPSPVVNAMGDKLPFVVS